MHARLEADRSQGADPEDPDEYRAVSGYQKKLAGQPWVYEGIITIESRE